MCGYAQRNRCDGIFKSGDEMRMMFYSLRDTGILGKKFECSYQESNLGLYCSRRCAASSNLNFLFFSSSS